MAKQHKLKRFQGSPTLHSMTGILAVINPRVQGRGTFETHANEMVAARMALAIREDPPHALRLALMQAYQRGRHRR